MRIRKRLIKLSSFVALCLMTSSVFGQDAFTLNVGEKNIFSQFNWHNSLIVNCASTPTHPTNPCNFGGVHDDDTPYQSAESQGNSAFVEVIAQPGSNGSSHAELGIKFSNINLNGYTIAEAKALPIKVTLNFSYYLKAESVFGSAGAALNIMPLAPSWYHIINNPSGGEFGMDNAIAIYNTNLGAIWNGVWMYLMSTAHTGIKDPLPAINSSSVSEVIVHSIVVDFLLEPPNINVQPAGGFVTTVSGCGGTEYLFTIKNDGGSDLTIDYIRIKDQNLPKLFTEPGFGFGIRAAVIPCPKELKPEQSCVFFVTYANPPLAQIKNAMIPITATLSIGSNDPDLHEFTAPLVVYAEPPDDDFVECKKQWKDDGYKGPPLIPYGQPWPWIPIPSK